MQRRDSNIVDSGYHADVGLSGDKDRGVGGAGEAEVKASENPQDATPTGRRDGVLDRVYDAGVIRRGSNVSAKPAFIVDCYLSGGAIGVFIGLFLYGAIAQLISLKAEYLFGGYVLGTALIFSGLFQIFWRGLSFEFLINSVFWSYISMLAIFRVLRYTKVLKEV